MLASGHLFMKNILTAWVKVLTGIKKFTPLIWELPSLMTILPPLKMLECPCARRTQKEKYFVEFLVYSNYVLRPFNHGSSVVQTEILL